MGEAIFLLIGVFGGAFFGRYFLGRRRGVVNGDEKETCAYWCPDDTKKTKTCDSGDSGKCLDDLINECPGNV